MAEAAETSARIPFPADCAACCSGRPTSVSWPGHSPSKPLLLLLQQEQIATSRFGAQRQVGLSRLPPPTLKQTACVRLSATFSIACGLVGLPPPPIEFAQVFVGRANANSLSVCVETLNLTSFGQQQLVRRHFDLPVDFWQANKAAGGTRSRSNWTGRGGGAPIMLLVLVAAARRRRTRSAACPV